MRTLDRLYPQEPKGVVFAYDYFWAKEKDPAMLCLRHIVGMNGEHKDFLLTDECARLGLDEDGKQELVRRVLEGMINDPQHWGSIAYRGGLAWSSALMASRAFLPDDEMLYCELLLRAAHQFGGRTSLEAFIRGMLPNPGQDSSLQDVVNHLVESGCPSSDIRDVWSNMLSLRDRENLKPGLIIEFAEHIQLDGHDFFDEAFPVAIKHILLILKQILVEGCLDRSAVFESPQDAIDLVARLATVVNTASRLKSEGVRQTTDRHFAQCFARGAATTAEYVMRQVGQQVYGLSTADREERLKKLKAMAIGIAETQKQFGVACALAQDAGDTAMSERLRENAVLFGQQVTMYLWQF